ncbi:MAG: acyltransferase family protein [Clostridia bacterium]|nr:acyltransferase family protein [Clostridia bacterium]
MNKRVAYLDIAKFIAIFSMVICHTMVSHLFDSIVHAFHMPIFFIVSGWCFNLKKHNKFKSFSLSRIKTLIVP